MDERHLNIIARVVHDSMRSFQSALGEEAAPPWDEAEQWQIDATLEGVKFLLEHPNAPTSAQHDQWMQQKLDDGWVHGETKDANAKTHPMLIAYEQLPLHERQKDALFQAVVRALTFKD